MIVSIHQPNYIPWIGYFCKIALSDLFVFFDTVQMPMGKSYVTRNRIKTATGALWLTVPQQRSSDKIRISQARIANQFWHGKHIGTIRNAYARSAWLEDVVDILLTSYEQNDVSVRDLNAQIIKGICRYLGMEDVSFVNASDLSLESSGAESIVEIVRKTNATCYLTGKGAGSMRHLDDAGLEASGIDVKFLNLDLPQYRQFHGEFVENLSIVDALLCCGPEGLCNLMAEASGRG